jgi:DHA1 family bicyclomycin/chloramphenicol resistance-like MFS transporter
MPIRPTSFAFTVLLAGMAALPALSIDMSLPALPMFQHEFGASAGEAGLTVSLFLAGFALAQLVLGPLSDRIGRRPVLLGAVVLYTAAALLCAIAPSIGLLNASRLLQGTGAAAGMAMSLAIVRDLFSGVAARVKLSYVAVVVGIAPIIAPSLGALLLQVMSWRAIFALHAAAGTVLAGAVALGLAETRPFATVPASVLASYVRMLTTRRAIGFAVVNAFSFGWMFSYIAGSPLLLMGSLGISTALYGLLFACTAASITLGSWLNGLLSFHHVPAGALLGTGLLVTLAASVGLAAVTLVGPLALVSLMPLLMLGMLCRGLVGPNATHGAIEPLPEVAGLASAVTGFLQMVAGALASAAVAGLYPLLGPSAMAAVMAPCALAALLAWRITVGRFRLRMA